MSIVFALKFENIYIHSFAGDQLAVSWILNFLFITSNKIVNMLIFEECFLITRNQIKLHRHELKENLRVSEEVEHIS